jgi:hypothetical protein
MSNSKHYVLGVFEDEDTLLHAIEEIRSKGVKIHEVFSPYPIHGIDELLGYKRSRLPRAAFLFGLTGTCCALTFMFYTMGFDWPMNIGGKSNAPLPDFIPVTFELTVLFAAFGMVGTFLTASNLFPWSKPIIFDERITDDKFVIAVDLAKNKLSKEEISSLLYSVKASEVNEKEV